MSLVKLDVVGGRAPAGRAVQSHVQLLQRQRMVKVEQQAVVGLNEVHVAWHPPALSP
jgi:hypothetical protein